MQIAKWVRERLGEANPDDAVPNAELDPETPVDDIEPADDENDDDPSVYPLW